MSVAALTLDRGGCRISAPELYFDFACPTDVLPATMGDHGGIVPREGETVPVGDYEGNRCLAVVERVEPRPGKPTAFWIRLDMETWRSA